MFISRRLKLFGLIYFAAIALTFAGCNASLVLASEVSNISPYTKEELLLEVNQVRSEASLPTFYAEADIERAAKLKGLYMTLKKYFNHWSPDQSVSPWNFLDLAGYEYRLAGENLASCYNSAQEVVAAMMASPLHRANLLSAEYRDIGIEVYPGLREGATCTMVVMYFGTAL